MVNYVEKKIYYHINTGNMFKINDVFNVGDGYNNFYQKIYNSEFLLDGKDANEILIDKRRNKKYCVDNFDEFRLVCETVGNDAVVTRELIFEEVRKEINNELPSRLKCLYVCENIDDLNKWLDIFKRTNKKSYQIVKLELTGNVFVGDASFILRQNISLNKKREQAKKYWSGECLDNIKETLFVGEAVVKEIVIL